MNHSRSTPTRHADQPPGSVLGSVLSRTRSAPRYTGVRQKKGRKPRARDRLFGSLPHIAELSYGDTSTENALVQGENLSVLERLQSHYSGKVRCVYIDPPYNNRERYRHYMDSRTHEAWLAMLVDRIAAIKPLLAIDGSLWISIDDREIHYLKVAADKIFGRENFVTTIVWQQRTSRENRKVFSNNHEYLLLYANDHREFRATRNPLAPEPAQLSRYRNPDSDPRGPWQSVSANAQDGHATSSQFYDLVAPNGTVHQPPEGRCWVYTQEKMRREIAAGNIWFGMNGEGVPRIKRFLKSARIGLTPETFWPAAAVGTTDIAKKQLLKLFPRNGIFETPKPERLIRRVLEIATNPGDLVLDAFLGSGTTAAVAHKLNRRYIGIEHGDHAETYCAARLRMVVDGEPTGISNEVNWTGGGGFRFYRSLG